MRRYCRIRSFLLAGLLAFAIPPSTAGAVTISLVPDGPTTIEIGETLTVDVFMVLDAADQLAGIEAATLQLKGGGGLVTVTASTTGSVFLHPPSILNTTAVLPGIGDFIAFAQFGPVVNTAEAFLASLTDTGAREGSSEPVARRFGNFPLITAPGHDAEGGHPNRYDFTSDETLRITVICGGGGCEAGPPPMEAEPPAMPPFIPPSDSGDSGSIPEPVPEPSSWLFLSLGIAGVVMIRRKLASRT